MGHGERHIPSGQVYPAGGETLFINPQMLTYLRKLAYQ